jgi:hypothetical protein
VTARVDSRGRRGEILPADYVASGSIARLGCRTPMCSIWRGPMSGYADRDDR